MAYDQKKKTRKERAEARGVAWRVHRKVRYRGLARNTAQLFTLFALANFHMARRELAVT